MTGPEAVQGVGCDVVSISDFCAQLELAGSRFGTVFTAGERRAAAGSAHPGASLAARWAAKEAVLKAWSSARFGHPPLVTGLPPERLWAQIEVRQDAWGRPGVRLHGLVAQALTGAEVRVSLSHDLPADVAMAVAVVAAPVTGVVWGRRPGSATAGPPAQDAGRVDNACSSAERR